MRGQVGELPARCGGGKASRGVGWQDGARACSTAGLWFHSLHIMCNTCDKSHGTPHHPTKYKCRIPISHPPQAALALLTHPASCQPRHHVKRSNHTLQCLELMLLQGRRLGSAGAAARGRHAMLLRKLG